MNLKKNLKVILPICALVLGLVIATEPSGTLKMLSDISAHPEFILKYIIF